MAASLESQEPHAMFARLFTCCFHRRPAPPSQKSFLPPEGSSGTESSNSTLPSSFSQQSLPQQSSPQQLLNSTSEIEPPTKPPPTFTKEDSDMPRAPRKTATKAAAKPAAKPAAKSVAKPAPKPKAPKVTKTTKPAKPKTKYFAGAEADDFIESGKSRDDQLNELFDSLRGAEDVEASGDNPDAETDTIGVDSIARYTKALGVDMYNFEFFVLCDILQTQNLGNISRKEFVEGWKKQVDSHNKSIKANMDAHRKFIRGRIQELPRNPDLFKKIYRQMFISGKDAQQKALEKEDAIAYWDELFSPALRPWKTAKVDWLDAWKRYLTDNWSRSVNKDMWNQTLEFATRTMEDDSLGFWSEDQAWPGVIDDFVIWCREQGVVAPPKKSADGMEVDE